MRWEEILGLCHAYPQHVPDPELARRPLSGSRQLSDGLFPK
jgi:hypothetical protein